MFLITLCLNWSAGATLQLLRAFILGLDYRLSSVLSLILMLLVLSVVSQQRRALEHDSALVVAAVFQG